MKFYKIFLVCSFMFNTIFANDNFSIIQSSNLESIIAFNIGDFSFNEENGYHKINSTSKVTIDNIGEPEIPTYGFNYAVDRNKEYSVSYNVLDFELFQNINIYPYQGIIEKDDFSKSNVLYASSQVYPEQNLVSSRMSLRGYDLYGIQLIPFEYDFESQTLKVYTSVEIVVTETDIRTNPSDTPRSKVFEDMYDNFVINNNDYQDSRNFQDPSILYIMEDYNSLIEPLVDWRRKQGYEVTVIDNDEDYNLGNF